MPFERSVLAMALGLTAPDAGAAVTVGAYVDAVNLALGNKSLRNAQYVSADNQVQWDDPDWLVPTRYLVATRPDAGSAWVDRTPVNQSPYTVPANTSHVRLIPTTSAGDLPEVVVGIDVFEVEITGPTVPLSSANFPGYTFRATVRNAPAGTLTYAWSVVAGPGAISGSTRDGRYTLTTPVTTDTTVTVRVTATVGGQSVTDDWSFVVTAPPQIVAPALSLSATSTSVESGDRITVSTVVVGGRWNSETLAWSATGGSPTSGTAATFGWTAPAVTSRTTYTITCTVTFRGGGSFAPGTVTRTATITIAVDPKPLGPPPTPNPTLSAGSRSLTEGSATTVRVNHGNAAGTVVSGVSWSGTGLSGSSRDSRTWTAPQVSADTPYTVSATVTVRGDGVTYNTTARSASASLTLTSRNRVDPVVAPSITQSPGSNALNGIAEGTSGTSRTLSVSLSGGSYDSVSYTWSKSIGTISGSGSSVTFTRPTWVPAAGRSGTVTLRMIFGRTGTSSVERTVTWTVRVTNVLRAPNPVARVNVTATVTDRDPISNAPESVRVSANWPAAVVDDNNDRATSYRYRWGFGVASIPGGWGPFQTTTGTSFTAAEASFTGGVQAVKVQVWAVNGAGQSAHTPGSDSF